MPCNYDAATFLVIAKSEADRLGKEPHIIFAPGFSKEGFQKPHKKAYNAEEMKFRLNHILFPLCYSLGLGFTYCRTRKHAEKIYYSSEDTFFPYEYEVDNPPVKLDRSCSLCHILEQHNKHKLFFPKPTQFAVDLIKKEFPYPPVVITLREAPYGQGRNSNLEEWDKFAAYVEDSNNVVFVRDTSKCNDVFVSSATDNLFFMETIPLASIDLDVRLALYKYAKINFTVGGGPIVLCHYSTDVPYRTFKLHSNQHGSSHEKFLESMGFPIGSQFPWHTENQKIIWEDDTFENLKREYDNWLEYSGA
jgi:hypothetical protein